MAAAAKSTIAITGANRGIGLELARQFCKRGSKVIALVRKSSAALQKLDNVRVVEGIDVGSNECVPKLKEAFAGENITALINNSGILGSDELSDYDKDLDAAIAQCRQNYEVNTLGPLRVSSALVSSGCLSEGSRIAIVTSLMGSISDNGSGGFYAYRMSKAAVNQVAKSLANDLEDKGIAVHLWHPGMVETDMVRAHGWSGQPVEDAVKGLLQIFDQKNDLSTTGTWWHGNYGNGIKKCEW